MGRRLKNSDRGVSIKVHKSFFDNVFEPERRNLESKLGLRLTQREFTEYLVKSKAKINYPKMRNTFYPRKVKARRFTDI